MHDPKANSAATLIDGLDGIAHDAVREAARSLGMVPVAKSVPEVQEEAYVAPQKTYRQLSDFVSEKSKQDHEKLYNGYVDALNRTSAELDGASKTDAVTGAGPFRSLKGDETYNLNAVYLHELHFANCFDPNSELFQDTLAFMRLQRDWGTFDAWMEEFQACAMSARNGWVICGYSFYLKRLINVVVDGHVGNIPIGFLPVIALDVWEHAYVSDYGTDRKSYVVAMMRELNWDVIEDRVKRLDGLREVMS